MLWNSNKGQIADFQKFWKLLLNDLEVKEQPELTQELEAAWKHHHHGLFQLYEGAVAVLTSLKREYAMALVSNCAIGLSDVIESLCLTGYFNCILLSYEVGVRKPDKRIYLEALNCLELEPDDCIFVADEISDLEGARRVGLKTMLVRQGSHPAHEAEDPTFKPDFECAKISEISSFL
jgi:HAD superfamily hydrolase (TIGR01509 family)